MQLLYRNVHQKEAESFLAMSSIEFLVIWAAFTILLYSGHQFYCITKLRTLRARLCMKRLQGTDRKISHACTAGRGLLCSCLDLIRWKAESPDRATVFHVAFTVQPFPLSFRLYINNCTLVLLVLDRNFSPSRHISRSSPISCTLDRYKGLEYLSGLYVDSHVSRRQNASLCASGI